MRQKTFVLRLVFVVIVRNLSLVAVFDKETKLQLQPELWQGQRFNLKLMLRIAIFIAASEPLNGRPYIVP